MGSKYTSNSASGYNATPPPDDGTVSEANKVKYSTVKTKLADPAKTLADDINTDLVEALDRAPVAVTSNTTLAAGHNFKHVQVSGSGVTLSLTDASSLGAGWNTDVVNTDTTNTVTLGRATASNTINETTGDLSILPLQQIRIAVNAAANGFLVDRTRRGGKVNRVSEETRMVGASLIQAEGAAIASAGTTEIWSVDGDTVHITGTTGITSLGTAVQAGQWKHLVFDDKVTLTHGANLVLQNGVNYTTRANQVVDVYADTTTQHRVFPRDGIIDQQTFNSSGTWTKPGGFSTAARALVQAWGGGGSGARGSNANGANGGGGGGGYMEKVFALSELGATETVTIGPGGTAVTGSDTAGVTGGNTTFGSLLTAYGGGGGNKGSSSIGGGGGGGGALAAGAGSASTAGTGSAGGGPNGGAGGASSAAGGDSTMGGGGGGGITAGPGGSSFWGGGGGGGGDNVTGNAACFGGNSVWGGGGGGGGAVSTVAGAGGTSLFGGNGGAGGIDNSAGAAGTQPGGGGGGSESADSGAGGDGRIIVTVWE